MSWKVEDDLRRGRLQGIACALAALAQSSHHDPVILRDLLDGMGLTPADLKRGGSDPLDLAAISGGLAS